MDKVVVIVCAMLTVNERAHADECVELCKAPVDPQVRSELYTGLAVIATGHAIGLIAQLSLHASGAERALASIPVVGAIEGVARGGDQVDIRMTLVFSAGVQIIGALLAITAWATRNENLPVSVGGNGMTLRF